MKIGSFIKTILKGTIYAWTRYNETSPWGSLGTWGGTRAHVGRFPDGTAMA